MLLLYHILEKADITAILRQFKTTRWDEDPVIHFYETLHQVRPLCSLED
ncbi:MAG: hypothetical protein ACE5OR_04550 [bacterium]